MAHAATLIPPDRATPPKPRVPASEFRMRSLEGEYSGLQPTAKGRGATFTFSLAVHTLLIAAVIVIPLLYEDVLPAPGDAVRAFFVAPAEVAPPPPPPPPPAAGVRPVVRKTPAAPRPVEPATFTAPIEVPEKILEEEAIDLGVEGGVPGGVEGGVPGGVVGGIVGGLPAEAPPPKVVRVGGKIVAPKLMRQIQPVYPELARTARLSGLVILEAHVDVHGNVVDVKVLRGQPLLDEAAVEAVKQWRYRPLLLNGAPTEFLLTVLVNFSFATASPR